MGVKKNPLSLGTVCAIDRSPLFPFPRPHLSLAFARSLAKFIHKSYLQPRYNPYPRSILSG